jgi:hypothetical protein
MYRTLIDYIKELKVADYADKSIWLDPLIDEMVSKKEAEGLRLEANHFLFQLLSDPELREGVARRHTDAIANWLGDVFNRKILDWKAEKKHEEYTQNIITGFFEIKTSKAYDYLDTETGRWLDERFPIWSKAIKEVNVAPVDVAGYRPLGTLVALVQGPYQEDLKLKMLGYFKKVVDGKYSWKEVEEILSGERQERQDYGDDNPEGTVNAPEGAPPGTQISKFRLRLNQDQRDRQTGNTPLAKVLTRELNGRYPLLFRLQDWWEERDSAQLVQLASPVARPRQKTDQAMQAEVKHARNINKLLVRLKRQINRLRINRDSAKNSILRFLSHYYNDVKVNEYSDQSYFVIMFLDENNTSITAKVSLSGNAITQLALEFTRNEITKRFDADRMMTILLLAINEVIETKTGSEVDCFQIPLYWRGALIFLRNFFNRYGINNDSIYLPDEDFIRVILNSHFWKNLKRHLKGFTMKAQNGGVDFSSASENLKVQNTGEGIKFHIDPAMIQRFKNTRAIMIGSIAIQNFESLPKFLGLDQTP